MLAPLFGIEAEIAPPLQPGLEHSVAHARMGWWAEEAQRLRAGHALHPLTRALLAQRPRRAGAAGGPDVSGLVDIATWDLAAATFETRRELTATATAGRAVTAAGRAGPRRSRRRRAAAVRPRPGRRAVRTGHAGVLRHSARLGRLRVPLEELAALGVAPEALAQPPWPAAAVRAAACSATSELRGAPGCRLRALRAPRTSARAARPAGVGGAACSSIRGARRAALPALLAAQPLGWRRRCMRAWRAARRAMHAQAEYLI